ncbi:MAG: hypothetical protein ACI9J3_003919, partial [Parvicellaceae bacterium]
MNFYKIITSAVLTLSVSALAFGQIGQKEIKQVYNECSISIFTGDEAAIINTAKFPVRMVTQYHSEPLEKSQFEMILKKTLNAPTKAALKIGSVEQFVELNTGTDTKALLYITEPYTNTYDHSPEKIKSVMAFVLEQEAGVWKLVELAGYRLSGDRNYKQNIQKLAESHYRSLELVAFGEDLVTHLQTGNSKQILELNSSAFVNDLWRVISILHLQNIDMREMNDLDNPAKRSSFKMNYDLLNNIECLDLFLTEIKGQINSENYQIRNRHQRRYDGSQYQYQYSNSRGAEIKILLPQSGAEANGDVSLRIWIQNSEEGPFITRLDSRKQRSHNSEDSMTEAMAEEMVKALGEGLGERAEEGVYMEEPNSKKLQLDIPIIQDGTVGFIHSTIALTYTESSSNNWNLYSIKKTSSWVGGSGYQDGIVDFAEEAMEEFEGVEEGDERRSSENKSDEKAFNDFWTKNITPLANNKLKGLFSDVTYPITLEIIDYTKEQSNEEDKEESDL